MSIFGKKRITKLRKVSPSDYLGERRFSLTKTEYRKYRRSKRRRYSF